MMSRGQIVLTDILVAFAVFILIADASILLWEYELGKVADTANRNQMEELARAASSQLLTSGEPSNWEELDALNDSSLHSFGLTSSSNVVEWSKVQKISQLSDPSSYGAVKRSLGLECCEAWFGVLYENGTVIGSFGNGTRSNGSSISIDRKAILNSSPVTVRLKVWQ